MNTKTNACALLILVILAVLAGMILVPTGGAGAQEYPAPTAVTPGPSPTAWQFPWPTQWGAPTWTPTATWTPAPTIADMWWLTTTPTWTPTPTETATPKPTWTPEPVGISFWLFLPVVRR